jgi:hypothetical protein
MAICGPHTWRMMYESATRKEISALRKQSSRSHPIWYTASRLRLVQAPRYASSRKRRVFLMELREPRTRFPRPFRCRLRVPRHKQCEAGQGPLLRQDSGWLRCTITVVRLSKRHRSSIDIEDVENRRALILATLVVFALVVTSASFTLLSTKCGQTPSAT